MFQLYAVVAEILQTNKMHLKL